jgi:hypothetical protein
MVGSGAIRLIEYIAWQISLREGVPVGLGPILNGKML